MRDFFPPLMREWEYVAEKMKAVAQSFGYEPYLGPLIEEVELYRAKSGEELVNEQIYSFTDRGGREVAIRPEMTPTLVRMVAQIHHQCPKPIRWYSIANLMRYERPQKGRLREHFQFNVDILGACQLEGTREVLQLVVNFLNELGANKEHFAIHLGHRQLMDSILQKVVKCSPEQTIKVYKIIDKAKKVSPAEMEKMVQGVNLSQGGEKILAQYLSLADFAQLKNFLKEQKETSWGRELEELFSLAGQTNLADYLVYDPTIVRGPDYYSGIVFEIFPRKTKGSRAIAGGGSYANLLEIFGQSPLMGVGLGLGDVTLLNFLKENNLWPNSFALPTNHLFLTFQEEEGHVLSLTLGQRLRQYNLNILSHLQTIKIAKALNLAPKFGAENLALIGEKEIAQDKVQIKNLERREQKEFSLQDIAGIKDYLLGQ